MAAAHEAARLRQPESIVPTKTGEEATVEMQGGWKAEGKEKPETPRICTRCQYIPKPSIDPAELPDKSTWCDACLEGKTLGHGPAGPKKPYVSKTEDAVQYNNAFFGGAL